MKSIIGLLIVFLSLPLQAAFESRQDPVAAIKAVLQEFSTSESSSNDTRSFDFLMNDSQGNSIFQQMYNGNLLSTPQTMAFITAVIKKIDHLYKPEDANKIVSLLQLATNIIAGAKLYEWYGELFQAINSSSIAISPRYEPLRDTWRGLAFAASLAYFKRRQTGFIAPVFSDTYEKLVLLNQMVAAVTRPHIRRYFYPNAFFWSTAKTALQSELPQAAPAFVVAHQDAFGITFSSRPILKGKAFTTTFKEKEAPVGYTIFFPPGRNTIKGIVITIYGGNTITSPTKLGDAKTISDITGALLAKNYATIELNLPDILENTQPQHQMSSEVFFLIQHALKNFIEQLKREPESLLDIPPMRALKGKPIFLQGTSFGGLMVTRFLELFPHVVDGAISINGLLSIDAQRKAGFSQLFSRVYPELSHLDPKHDIDKLADPLLIVHNVDDHNVPIVVSLDLFKAAKENNKPVSFTAIRRGTKAPFNANLNILDYRQKGHGLREESTAIVAQRMLAFLEDQQPKSRFQDWQAMLYETLFARYNQRLPLEDKFVSEGLRIYRAAFNQRGLDARDIVSSDENLRDGAFRKFYAPTLYALAEWERLKEQIDIPAFARSNVASQNFTDEHLLNGARIAAQSLIPFLEDFYDLSLTNYIDEHEFAVKLAPSLRQWVSHDSPEIVEFIWKCILLGNNDRNLFLYPLDETNEDDAALIERNKQRLIEAIRDYKRRSAAVMLDALKKAAQESVEKNENTP